MMAADLAPLLGLASPAALRWHLIALPSWDPRPAEKAPAGRPCVRVTLLAHGPRGLVARVVEAESEAAALESALHGGVL